MEENSGSIASLATRGVPAAVSSTSGSGTKPFIKIYDPVLMTYEKIIVINNRHLIYLSLLVSLFLVLVGHRKKKISVALLFALMLYIFQYQVVYVLQTIAEKLSLTFPSLVYKAVVPLRLRAKLLANFSKLYMALSVAASFCLSFILGAEFFVFLEILFVMGQYIRYYTCSMLVYLSLCASIFVFAFLVSYSCMSRIVTAVFFSFYGSVAMFLFIEKLLGKPWGFKSIFESLYTMDIHQAITSSHKYHIFFIVFVVSVMIQLAQGQGKEDLKERLYHKNLTIG